MGVWSCLRGLGLPASISHYLALVVAPGAGLGGRFLETLGDWYLALDPSAADGREQVPCCGRCSTIGDPFRLVGSVSWSAVTFWSKVKGQAEPYGLPSTAINLTGDAYPVLAFCSLDRQLSLDYDRTRLRSINQVV